MKCGKKLTSQKMSGINMMDNKLRAELIADDTELKDFLCDIAVGSKKVDIEYMAAIREFLHSPYTATPKLVLALENKLASIINDQDYLDHRHDLERIAQRKIDDETLQNVMAHIGGSE